MRRLRATFLLAALGFIWGPCWRSAKAAETPRPQWILVTAPAFRNAAEPLCQHRKSGGMQVVVVRTTDVLTADEIRGGDGRKLCEHIHKLCRQSQGLSYVLLIGAIRSSDPGAAERIVVPPLSGSIGRMKAQPTDNGYGCLDQERLPTIAAGRLPARSEADVTRMVQKIVAFEREANSGAWRRYITLLVGNPGGSSIAERMLGNWYVDTACRATADRLHPSWRVNAIYHIPTSQFYVPDSALRAKAIDFLQRGQAFTFYLGHSDASGFWSGAAPFLSRDDWAELAIPHGGGIFVTCGCYGCQLSSRWPGEGEGYGVAAIRNPAGPVAVMGAHGESYAAMGQLAFEGLLRCLRGPELPARLGECYLALKGGLAAGPMDPLTFRMFDYVDGSRGTIEQSVQRQEHLEMWMLLGDPALRLPQVDTVEMKAEGKVVKGGMLRLVGTVPRHLRSARVRIALERPVSSAPADLQRVPDGPPEARTEVMLANHEKANRLEVSFVESKVVDGRFEAAIQLPASLPWPRVTLRAVASEGENDAIGVLSLLVSKSERSAK